jgi:hypothetical protein
VIERTGSSSAIYTSSGTPERLASCRMTVTTIGISSNECSVAMVALCISTSSMNVSGHIRD